MLPPLIDDDRYVRDGGGVLVVIVLGRGGGEERQRAIHKSVWQELLKECMERCWKQDDGSKIGLVDQMIGGLEMADRTWKAIGRAWRDGSDLESIDVLGGREDPDHLMPNQGDGPSTSMRERAAA